MEGREGVDRGSVEDPISDIDIKVASDPGASPADLGRLAQAEPRLWPVIAANPAAPASGLVQMAERDRSLWPIVAANPSMPPGTLATLADAEPTLWPIIARNPVASAALAAQIEANRGRLAPPASPIPPAPAPSASSPPAPVEGKLRTTMRRPPAPTRPPVFTAPASTAATGTADVAARPDPPPAPTAPAASPPAAASFAPPIPHLITPVASPDHRPPPPAPAPPAPLASPPLPPPPASAIAPAALADHLPRPPSVVDATLPAPPGAPSSAAASDGLPPPPPKPPPPSGSSPPAFRPVARTSSPGASIGSALSSLRKLVVAVLIVGGLASIAYFWLNGYRRPASLSTGACITEIPMYSNVDTKTVPCSSSEAAYKVVSNLEASSYRETDTLADRCESNGYLAVPPDSDAYDSGDHMVLCLRRA